MPETRSNAANLSNVGDGAAGGNARNTSTANPTIAVKVPRFWKENPSLWFAQIEAQFELHQISNERTKYFIIIADLDHEILNQVSDIVTNPPFDAYKKIKERLVEIYSITEDQRIQTLLTNMQIGDTKPSSLLRQMKSLANGGVTDDFLRNMWLQRLPPQTQAILATSSEPLESLAKMADKIGDIQAPTNSNISEVYSLKDISNQIEVINSKIRKLQDNRDRSRNKSRGRYEESPSSRSASENGFCYYHRRFKERARKCRSPCSFVYRSSENLQPGR